MPEKRCGSPVLPASAPKDVEQGRPHVVVLGPACPDRVLGVDRPPTDPASGRHSIRAFAIGTFGTGAMHCRFAMISAGGGAEGRTWRHDRCGMGARYGVWQRFATKWAIAFTNSSQ